MVRSISQLTLRNTTTGVASLNWNLVLVRNPAYCYLCQGALQQSTSICFISSSSRESLLNAKNSQWNRWQQRILSVSDPAISPFLQVSLKTEPGGWCLKPPEPPERSIMFICLLFTLSLVSANADLLALNCSIESIQSDFENYTTEHKNTNRADIRDGYFDAVEREHFVSSKKYALSKLMLYNNRAR